MLKPKKRTPKGTYIGLRLPDATLRLLKERAASERRELAVMARILVEDGLAVKK